MEFGILVRMEPRTNSTGYRKKLVLIGLLMCCTIPGCFSTQGRVYHTLHEIQVYDSESGFGVEGAEVIVERAGGSVIRSAVTDDRGVAAFSYNHRGEPSFSKLARGIHRAFSRGMRGSTKSQVFIYLRIRKEGYEDWVRRREPYSFLLKNSEYRRTEAIAIEPVESK